MKTTRSGPFRKSFRRWLLAAFVFVMVAVSLAGWWYWPRGDARFIGKWDVRLGSDTGQRVGQFEFCANGTGWHPMMNIPLWIPSWSVRQDEFVIGTNRTGVKTDLRLRWERFLARFTGLEIDDSERVFEVLAVAVGQIDLRMKADGRHFVFLRME